MCGIVGYVGPREATEVVIGGLKRLEYRGYDSAGIAIDGGGEIQLRRSVGKLSNLVAQLRERPTAGGCGIGHTRWATHGGVTEENAHPHRDASGEIVVIQNGIVENYLELKQQLIARGHSFQSQTDTEVIARLLGDEYAKAGSLEAAMRATLAQLRGGNAVVALARREPGRLVAARLGNAGGIVVGLGEGETFVASDVPAILDYTQRMVFLEDRELAVITASGARISRLDGTPIERQPTVVAWDPVAAAKALVGGDQHRRFAVLNAPDQGFRREAAEDHGMDRADPRAGEHRVGRLGDHRHVDRDPVALLDPASLQHIGEPAHVLVHLGIGDVLVLARAVALPEDRGLVRPRRQVTVDAVPAGIEGAVVVPADPHVAGVVDVPHLGVGLDPV